MPFDISGEMLKWLWRTFTFETTPLNVKTLKFEEFISEFSNEIPYAILSHTWGEREVSCSDHINWQSLSKKDFEKIHGCCKLTESEGFQYAWIDPCCIDKLSNAELSEAINPMFKCYRGVGICYAYLSDVDSSEDPRQRNHPFSEAVGSHEDRDQKFALLSRIENYKYQRAGVAGTTTAWLRRCPQHLDAILRVLRMKQIV